VATKGWQLGGLVEFSTAPAVAYDTRTHIVVPATCSMLTMPFANISHQVNAGERDGPNNITVKAALEIGATHIPLTFNGARNAVIEPGGVIWSDPIAVEPSPAASLFLRTRVTCAAAALIPLGRYVVTGDGSGVVIDGADQCYATGALSGAIAAYTYSPACVVGQVRQSDSKRAIAIIGDSISIGAGDTTVPSTGLRGMFERALASNFAYVTTGCSGGSLAIWATKHHRAWSIISGMCDYAVCNSGINDAKNGKANPGPTLAAMQANAVAMWSELRWQHGIVPTHTTTTPFESSPGVADAQVEAVRVPFNEWLRDGAPFVAATGATVRVGHPLHPLLYVHELADIAETARNSGLWKAGYTTDLTHPIQAGHVALAAGINTSVFV
jgi:lysophospholipase L1-like esterase